MFIDIHAHAYLFPSPPQDGHTQFCTPDEVLAYYDQVGIERGILLPLIGPEVYLPQSNQEVLEICRCHPDRFSAFCNIDPRGISNTAFTDFSPWLDWFQTHGVLGVGEFMPNMAFRDPRVLNFFRQVAERHWPLTFDVTTRIGVGYGLVDDPGLPQLEYCLQKFPAMTILGHGPAFWSEMSVLETIGDRNSYPKYPVHSEGAVPKLFRRYLNLWGDLSAGSGYNALARDVDNAILFLNEFQDRLCYGTDYCYSGGGLPLAEFLLDLRKSGHISADTFEKIARRNAIRLLHLPEK